MISTDLGHFLFFRSQRSNLGHISQQYEKLKREWAEAHPEATPQEYEQAIREIAAMLGY
jgi:t-SNARE complex subunit (syntaxin)